MRSFHQVGHSEPVFSKIIVFVHELFVKYYIPKKDNHITRIIYAFGCVQKW